MLLTIIGWLVIIAAAIAARVHIQHIYNMPTDYDRFRSWRYHRAIRTSLRANQRKLAKARRQQHTHVFTVFGADVGVLVQRCSTCGHIEEV